MAALPDAVLPPRTTICRLRIRWPLYRTSPSLLPAWVSVPASLACCKRRKQHLPPRVPPLRYGSRPERRASTEHSDRGALSHSQGAQPMVRTRSLSRLSTCLVVVVPFTAMFAVSCGSSDAATDDVEDADSAPLDESGSDGPLSDGNADADSTALSAPLDGSALDGRIRDGNA